MDDSTLALRVALGVVSIALGALFVLRRDAIAGRARRRRGPHAQTGTPAAWTYAGVVLAAAGLVQVLVAVARA